MSRLKIWSGAMSGLFIVGVLVIVLRVQSLDSEQASWQLDEAPIEQEKEPTVNQSPNSVSRTEQLSEYAIAANEWFLKRMQLPLGEHWMKLEERFPGLRSSLGIDFSSPSELPAFQNGLLSEDIVGTDSDYGTKLTFYSFIDGRMEGKTLIHALDMKIGIDYIKAYTRILKAQYGCPERINCILPRNISGRVMVLIYGTGGPYRYAEIALIDEDQGEPSGVHWNECSELQAFREPVFIRDTHPVEDEFEPLQFLKDAGLVPSDVCL